MGYDDCSMESGESLTDRINQAFGAPRDPSFDPSRCLAQIIALLDEVCAPGGECDLSIAESREKACNLYGGQSNRFLSRGCPSAAETLLIDGWNKFGHRQLETRERVYRAGLAMYLTIMYGKLGDKGAALRWALHTQADDMLGEHEQGGGAGKQWLLTILGMSNQALIEFNGIAVHNVKLVNEELEGDWSDVHGFAEDVVMRFALEKPEFAHLLALESSVHEFPISQAYFSSLLKRASAPHPTATSKGDSLEDLASYLFLLIPGWVPRRNLLDEYHSFETDIVVRNLGRPSNLTAELLGRHFLVECKNWELPVGVRDVGYFLYRMRLTHARFGVLFAKTGITGDEANERAAHSLIRKAFHEDGSICVVLDESDLTSLADGQLSFWPILLERIERVRFGKPK
jgi:hypothetical protein